MYQIPLIIRKKNLKYNLYQYQNNGLLHLSVDRIYSIDAFSIALLQEFSQFGLPNKTVLTILSSFSVKMFASIAANLSKRVRVRVLKFPQWRKNEPLFQYHYCNCISDQLSLESCQISCQIFNSKRVILQLLFGMGLIKLKIWFFNKLQTNLHC